jgi:hypothetical protein
LYALSDNGVWLCVHPYFGDRTSELSSSEKFVVQRFAQLTRTKPPQSPGLPTHKLLIKYTYFVAAGYSWMLQIKLMSQVSLVLVP